MVTEYSKYEPLFGSWHIEKLLGEGSYGKVYEIHREDFGVTYKAALKAITIPKSQSELKSVIADGMDKASLSTYYRSFAQEFTNEFALMDKVKGHSNIVSYEDHAVLAHEDGIGWDILIRMELLTPLTDYQTDHEMTVDDIVRLGIDISKAIELCEQYNIIHRDIKPENIFVTDRGDYKLGDFGIARVAEKTTGASTKIGTQSYMAPEILKGEKYTSKVDIYSLGLMLYKYLNHNRLPFLPAPPEPITFSVKEAANIKRLTGAPMPAPANADENLSRIVLKAAAYDPSDRYANASQLRKDLESYLAGKSSVGSAAIPAPAPAPAEQKADLTELLVPGAKKKVKPEPVYEETQIISPPGIPEPAPAPDPAPVPTPAPASEKPQDDKRELKKGIVAALAAVVGFAVITAIVVNIKGSSAVKESASVSQVATGSNDTTNISAASGDEDANNQISLSNVTGDLVLNTTWGDIDSMSADMTLMAPSVYLFSGDSMCLSVLGADGNPVSSSDLYFAATEPGVANLIADGDSIIVTAGKGGVADFVLEDGKSKGLLEIVVFDENDVAFSTDNPDEASLPDYISDDQKRDMVINAYKYWAEEADPDYSRIDPLSADMTKGGSVTQEIGYFYYLKHMVGSMIKMDPFPNVVYYSTEPLDYSHQFFKASEGKPYEMELTVKNHSTTSKSGYYVMMLMDESYSKVLLRLEIPFKIN